MINDTIRGHLSHILHSVNVVADHCGMMSRGIESNDRALVERGCLALHTDSVERVPGLQPDGHLGAVEP